MSTLRSLALSFLILSLVASLPWSQQAHGAEPGPGASFPTDLHASLGDDERSGFVAVLNPFVVPGCPSAAAGGLLAAHNAIPTRPAVYYAEATSTVINSSNLTSFLYAGHRNETPLTGRYPRTSSSKYPVRKTFLTRPAAAAGIVRLSDAAPGGTIAAVTDLRSLLPSVASPLEGARNVKEYGALGDGIKDDKGAIQAAFDAVPSTGGLVWFPPGIYKITGSLIPKSNTTIAGSGYASQILIPDAAWVKGILPDTKDYGAISIVNVSNIRVTGLRFNGGLAESAPPDYSRAISHIHVSATTGAGIFLQVDHCFFENNRSAAMWQAGSISKNSRVIITNNFFRAIGREPLFFAGVPNMGGVVVQLNMTDVTIAHNVFYMVGTAIAATGERINVIGNIIDDAVGQGIMIGDNVKVRSIIVTDNVLYFPLDADHSLIPSTVGISVGASLPGYPRGHEHIIANNHLMFEFTAGFKSVAAIAVYSQSAILANNAVNFLFAVDHTSGDGNGPVRGIIFSTNEGLDLLLRLHGNVIRWYSDNNSTVDAGTGILYSPGAAAAVRVELRGNRVTGLPDASGGGNHGTAYALSPGREGDRLILSIDGDIYDGGYARFGGMAFYQYGKPIRLGYDSASGFVSPSMLPALPTWDTGDSFAAVSSSGGEKRGPLITQKQVVVPFSATPAFDAQAGNFFNITLTGNITSWRIINGLEGQQITIRFKQDDTGDRTMAGAVNVLLAGGNLTLSTGANRTDSLTLTFDRAGGLWIEQGRALNIH